MSFTFYSVSDSSVVSASEQNIPARCHLKSIASLLSSANELLPLSLTSLFSCPIVSISETFNWLLLRYERFNFFKRKDRNAMNMAHFGSGLLTTFKPGDMSKAEPFQERIEQEIKDIQEQIVVVRGKT